MCCTLPAVVTQINAHEPGMIASTVAPGSGIGTLNEGPLHAALKDWYARSGDRTEVPIDGRFVDLVRGDLLIEIQTGTFAGIRHRLERLLTGHRVHLIYPIAHEKWVVRLDDRKEGGVLGRRKSPNRGRVEDAFEELVSIARLLAHERFSVEILLTQEDELRRHEPGRVWRRKGWVIVERRLISVVERHRFDDTDDLQRLLPTTLSAAFTTADLAESLHIPLDLAQKMAYCFREAGVVRVEGKRGNSRVYSRLVAACSGP